MLRGVPQITMRTGAARKRAISNDAEKARRKFLRFFPDGFTDETYIAWERGYKWRAHERWNDFLPPRTFRELLSGSEYQEIAARALRTLAGTNLLFSFESMALRDALKTTGGAQNFAVGLFEFIHGRGSLSRRFDDWCHVIAALPKKQSRVLTHPVVTVFGFIAQPDVHVFFKPNVTRTAAKRYGFEIEYSSRPSWETYRQVLEFASVIADDLKDLKPRDMIDIQSFIWVTGSSEYE